MTARTRSRTFLVGAAVAALLAPLVAITALASSASAAVGPRPHEVYMYKVEAQVDLSGEYPDNYASEHLSCNDGDYALDGMWRVEHVDQANPQLGQYGDERDVTFYASYSHPSDPSEWDFRFENHADGNAQVKLFITCIRKQTEENAGHKHNIVLSTPYVFNHPAEHNGYTVWSDFYHDATCGPNEYPVAPGFNFVNDDVNRLTGSYPSQDLKGWNWSFVIDDSAHPGAVDVDVAFRCLSNRVAPNFGHTHQLPMSWRTNVSSPYSGYDTYLYNTGISEQRLSCDDGTNGAAFSDYKAMVGAFWLYDWQHTWYLGMDPRPKTRAYSFYNDGYGGSHVGLNVLCVKSRTGKQIRP